MALLSAWHCFVCCGCPVSLEDCALCLSSLYSLIQAYIIYTCLEIPSKIYLAKKVSTIFLPRSGLDQCPLCSHAPCVSISLFLIICPCYLGEWYLKGIVEPQKKKILKLLIVIELFPSSAKLEPFVIFLNKNVRIIVSILYF